MDNDNLDELAAEFAPDPEAVRMSQEVIDRLDARAKAALKGIVRAETEIHLAIHHFHSGGTFTADELGPMWAAIDALHEVHARLGTDPTFQCDERFTPWIEDIMSRKVAA